MKQLFILLILCITFSIQSYGQHYQKIINNITACTTLSCIEQIRQQNKPLNKFTPVSKQLGTNLTRYHLDYFWADGPKEENKRKHFRVSLLLSNDAILYGQLEQLSNDYLLEATYLFKNDAAQIQELIILHNKQQSEQLKYRDLIEATTVRFPFFWLKL